MMVIVIVLVVGTLGLLLHATWRSIRDERTKGRSVWREFSLSLIFMTLFFAAWLGQVITQWQEYTDEVADHGGTTKLGDFVSKFFSSTLQNWQSEFLQLFSFVTMSALYIHKSSAESKDGEENMEASLRRIETALGTLPASAPIEEGQQWKLPETPLEVADEVRRGHR